MKRQLFKEDPTEEEKELMSESNPAVALGSSFSVHNNDGQSEISLDVDTSCVCSNRLMLKNKQKNG